MIFEKASRLKLRFEYKGMCSVEDLWDLPLETLNTLFKRLNRRAKDSKEEDLLERRTREDEILELQVEIVRHIVTIRLVEQREREEKLEKAAKKQKLLGLIAEKQDASLREMSEEELVRMVDEL